MNLPIVIYVLAHAPTPNGYTVVYQSPSTVHIPPRRDGTDPIKVCVLTHG